MNNQTVVKEKCELTYQDIICTQINTTKLHTPLLEFIENNPEHHLPAGTAIMVNLKGAYCMYLFYKTRWGWIHSRLNQCDMEKGMYYDVETFPSNTFREVTRVVKMEIDELNDRIQG